MPRPRDHGLRVVPEHRPEGSKRINARRLRHALQAHCPECGALAQTRCPGVTKGFHEARADLAFQQRMTAGK